MKRQKWNVKIFSLGRLIVKNYEMQKGPMVGPAELGDEPKGPTGLGYGKETCLVRLG